MKLSDRDLLFKTEELVKSERKILKQILDYLGEIQRRRLYCDLGYSTLFKYLVHHLGYSEGAAARRVNALRLIQKVPAAKGMIEKGELNLTNVGLLHKFEKQSNDVTKVLSKIKNTSSEECQKILFEEGLIPEKKQTVIRCSKNEKRLSITLKCETMDKLQKLCALEKLELDALLDRIAEEKANAAFNRSEA